jgi:hypothetical protein
MGSLLDDELRRPALSRWAPGPAGAVELQGASSATLLEDTSGRWEYGKEIPIVATLNEIEFAALPGRDALFWAGIKVVVDRKDLPDPGRRYYLTASLHPPSFLWYVQAPLLPVLDKSAMPGWRDSLRDLANGTIHISQLPFDPFEDDSQYLVARLGDLVRPHWEEKRSKDLGDGFLVVRSRNRQSRKRREWLFGLCPAPPEEVVMALVQRNQGFVLDEAARSRFRPREPLVAPAGSPGKVVTQRPGQEEDRLLDLLGLAPAGDRPQQGVDWRERQQMSSAGEYVPDDEFAQLCLNAAVRQPLARHEGSTITLDQRIERRFLNHFRDLDARMKRMDKPFGKVRLKVEKDYRDFIGEHPECDRFRRRGRLDLKLLDRTVYLPDAEDRRCRDLFFRYHLEAEAKRAKQAKKDDAEE